MRGCSEAPRGQPVPGGSKSSQPTSWLSMLVTEVPSRPGTVTTRCGPGAGHRQCAHRAFQLRGKSQGGRTPEGGRWGNFLMDGFVANGCIPSCFPLCILFCSGEPKRGFLGGIEEGSGG